jgi:hypothetical protein
MELGTGLQSRKAGAALLQQAHARRSISLSKKFVQNPKDNELVYRVISAYPDL